MATVCGGCGCEGAAGAGAEVGETEQLGADYVAWLNALDTAPAPVVVEQLEDAEVRTQLMQWGFLALAFVAVLMIRFRQRGR